MIMSRVALRLVVIAAAGCTHGSSAPMPSVGDESTIAAGDSLYHRVGCDRCHGVDAEGTLRGGSLRTNNWKVNNGSLDDLIRVISAGVPASALHDRTRSEGMPPRGGAAITTEQIRQLAAFVYAISRR